MRADDVPPLVFAPANATSDHVIASLAIEAYPVRTGVGSSSFAPANATSDHVITSLALEAYPVRTG